MDSKKLAADYLGAAIEAAKRKRMKARCFPPQPGDAAAAQGDEETPIDAEALAAMVGEEDDDEYEE